MKLTFDARLIKASGIGVYIQNIIKSPLLEKYELRLIHKKKDIDYFKELLSQPELIEFNAELYSVKELIFSPATTRNTDIFWSPHYNVPIINFAKRLQVVTIHDVFHLAFYNTLSNAQKMYAKAMINRAVKSDIVFTVSEFSKAEIIKYTSCKPEKIKVVYNGIDFEKFNKKKPEEQTNRILKNYHLSSPYILFVGNVKPHKNLKTALLGFKYYCQSTSSTNLKFVIAGKRDGFITGDPEVKIMIETPFFREKVLFTGWIADEDLPSIYQKAALFIFPSIYEGFGFPPLEAMAAGCPVISSNSACMQEIYNNAALYFYPLDETAIGERIHEVLHNDQVREDLVRKGLKKAQEYKWGETVGEKLGLIEKYLSKS